MAYVILALEAAIAYLFLYSAGVLKTAKMRFLSAGLVLLAFAARALCMEHRSMDYLSFLSCWMVQIHENGGLASLASQIGNYNLPYLTLLTVFSYLPIGDLYLIKLLSIFFDIVLAWSVMKITGKLTDDTRKMLIAFFAVLLWPTVIINSAFWGQCDSIYVAMGILGIYLALDDRPVLSMICIAVSFGFKLQAVFIMPVYAVLWMNGKFKWQHFLIFPAAYIVLISPALFAGRSFADTLFLYSMQTADMGQRYSYTGPSFLSIVQASPSVLASLNTPEAISSVCKLFVVISFAFVVSVLAVCYLKRTCLNDFTTVLIAALFSVGIPYLLPQMTERYFYYADIMLLLLALIDSRFLILAVLQEAASLVSYWAYYSSITGSDFIPVFAAAFAIGFEFIALIIVVCCHFKKHGDSNEVPDCC